MNSYKAAPRPGDLPWSMAAERALIGAALIDEDEVWAEGVPAAVRTADFYFAPHRAIWAAMLLLRKARQPITCVTVSQMLATQGWIEDVDNLTAPEYTEPYLMAVMGETWATVGCIAHARMVRDYAARREMIDKGAAAVRQGYSGAMAAGAEWLTQYEGQL